MRVGTVHRWGKRLCPQWVVTGTVRSVPAQQLRSVAVTMTRFCHQSSRERQKCVTESASFTSPNWTTSQMRSRTLTCTHVAVSD